MTDWRTELEAARQRWRQYDIKPIDPPDEPVPFRNQFALEWVDREDSPESPEDYYTLTDARDVLYDQLRAYVARRRGDPPVLLVKAKPGLGKTYAGIKIAQELARGGKRVLYLMPTHEHWHTLNDFPHFNPNLWYHWLSYNHPNPYQNFEEPMCRHADVAEVWLEKGFPLKSLCNSYLDCPVWQSYGCAYRKQSEVPEKIIAGVHEHLVCGLSISHFHTVIVDELPIRAFLTPTAIPLEGIKSKRAFGPLAELQSTLYTLAESGGTYKGKALMYFIGELLADVYAQLEHADLMPAIPVISTLGELEDEAYWYADDLLLTLSGEYEMWRRGESRWLERVIIEGGKLHLLTRSKVWKKAPKRTIVLDATANDDLYKLLLNRDIQTLEPQVAMVGNIRQVVNRYNGITTMIDDRTQPAKAATEAVMIVKRLIKQEGYANPGVVTFLGLIDYVKSELNTDKVAHFYGQRGSNSLESCDAVFIVGTPSPPDKSLMQSVAIINQDRIDPFEVIVTADNRFIPVRSLGTAVYNIIRNGQQATRKISGFWTDSELRTLHDSWCADELSQAIHRGRPLVSDTDVWLLSSQPTGDQLTDIYNDPGDLFDVPEGVHWVSWLKILDYIDSLDLGATFGYEELAEVAGTTVRTARNQKWLPLLASLYPDEVEVTRLRRMEVTLTNNL